MSRLVSEKERKNELYSNKTLHFFMRAMTCCGQEFVEQIKLLNIQKFGLYDYIGQNLKGNNIYILFTKKEFNPSYHKVIDFLKNSNLYISDYIYGPDPYGLDHMLVIKIPEEIQSVYDHFLKSEYSKMYSQESVENSLLELNSKFNPNNIDKFEILIHEIFAKKGNKAKKSYLSELNKWFGVDFSDINIDNHKEWSIPLVIQEETFNYNKRGNKFFNYKEDKVW